ncbi:hypothetical protein HN587_02815 [Candidatus Woesearchaeota archaeon]|jgi:hypothetical protein|nr:hypothetical protein [Candidatus Woesearchaeota archaeon]
MFNARPTKKVLELMRETTRKITNKLEQKIEDAVETIVLTHLDNPDQSIDGLLKKYTQRIYSHKQGMYRLLDISDPTNESAVRAKIELINSDQTHEETEKKYISQALGAFATLASGLISYGLGADFATSSIIAVLTGALTYGAVELASVQTPFDNSEAKLVMNLAAEKIHEVYESHIKTVSEKVYAQMELQHLADNS